MKVTRSLFLVLTACGFAAGSEPATPSATPRLLIFPSSPPEKKASEAMQAELKRLQEDSSFSKLKAWNRLKELPAWAFGRDTKIEIAYLGYPPAAMDAFRYAVIIAPDRETIIVRTGGFAGVYEIYQRPKTLRAEDLVGVYEAEHAIDTIERITLKPDGKFDYVFLAILGNGSGYEGRWELREQMVVLIARDKDGKDAEFPLEILRPSPDLALIYSRESYATAKATMLLADSYRRTSKTPSRSP